MAFCLFYKLDNNNQAILSQGLGTTVGAATASTSKVLMPVTSTLLANSNWADMHRQNTEDLQIMSSNDADDNEQPFIHSTKRKRKSSFQKKASEKLAKSANANFQTNQQSKMAPGLLTNVPEPVINISSASANHPLPTPAVSTNTVSINASKFLSNNLSFNAKSNATKNDLQIFQSKPDTNLINFLKSNENIDYTWATVTIEMLPELILADYLKALKTALGASSVKSVFKENGQLQVTLASRELADRLLEESGLRVNDSMLRVRPFRKRAERLVLTGVAAFVPNRVIQAALRPWGNATSIQPLAVKVAGMTIFDGRREVIFDPKDEGAANRIPQKLEVVAHDFKVPIFISRGIKCSFCRKSGHLRSACPIKTVRRAEEDSNTQSTSLNIQAQQTHPTLPDNSTGQVSNTEPADIPVHIPSTDREEMTASDCELGIPSTSTEVVVRNDGHNPKENNRASDLSSSKRETPTKKPSRVPPVVLSVLESLKSDQFRSQFEQKSIDIEELAAACSSPPKIKAWTHGKDKDVLELLLELVPVALQFETVMSDNAIRDAFKNMSRVICNVLGRDHLTSTYLSSQTQ